MAISNITQFQAAIETPLTPININVGSGLSSEYIYGSAVRQGVQLSVDEYGAANAFRVVNGGLGADGATATATEVLTSEAVVESGTTTGAKIIKFPAQGQAKAGALAGKVPIGTLLGGIAIGAGIGLKEAATHRKFWEDLVSIGDGINSPEQTVNVIWRMLQDGSIASYCDKRTVDKLIQRLYEYNALNSGEVTPIVDQIGWQDVTFGTIDIAVIMAAANAGGFTPPAEAVSAALSGAIASAHGATITAMSANVYERRDTDFGRVSVSVYNMPSWVNVQYREGYFFVQDPRGGIVSYYVQYILSTGEIVGAGAESVGSDVLITPTQLSSGYAYASNVGCNVTPFNDNIIINPDALPAPSDPDDFWTTFSEWLSNALQQPGYNPLNNAIVPTTWIPFTFPNINWQIDPAVGIQPGIWEGKFPFPDPYPAPGTEPAPDKDPWLWPGIGTPWIPPITIPTPIRDPWDDTPIIDNPNPGPIGETPPIPAPTSGLSDALFTVYNPSQANVNALGAYLWTQNIIELIAQLFQNPLDAIISLHLVYCTPSTGNNKNIKLGYLDSGVSAPVVTSQYVDIVCGDVQVPEIYHNALDYNKTSIEIFLPFIGFRELSVKECMGGKLRVTYKIDVYTGTCLASIYVIKPNVSQLLYTFEGNCAVDIPLTSSDRSRMVSGLIMAGVSAATGNPAGVVGGLASMGANIERSGSFSGNAGAMGVKKPYLIIRRALSAKAYNYSKYEGYPLNKTARLGSFMGFTRCESVHVDIPGATERERNMIESLLRSGIVI